MESRRRDIEVDSCEGLIMLYGPNGVLVYVLKQDALVAHERLVGNTKMGTSPKLSTE
jgi:hypothetical protein